MNFQPRLRWGDAMCRVKLGLERRTMEPETARRALTSWSQTERRLVSIVVLLLGLGLLMALPFVLSAGSEFFLPLATAFILSVILSPLADLLRRTGLPNALAALAAVLFLPVVMVLAVMLILQPSLDLLARLPELTRRMLDQLETLRGSFSAVSNVANELGAITGTAQQQEVVIAAPTVFQQIATATPAAVFEIAIVILLSYFFLEARFRLRRRLLLDRSDFGASVRASRVLRDVHEQVGAYIVTAGSIAAAIGAIVGLFAWAYGFDAPIMWGGLAAFLNLLPYFGPMTMAMLLAAYGLGTEDTVLAGVIPAACYLSMHVVEANMITPMILGRRLTLSPIAILASMIFFSWVWGIIGIFLSVPILLMAVALMSHVGAPNLIGFLLGEPLFVERPGPLGAAGASQSEPVDADAIHEG